MKTISLKMLHIGLLCVLVFFGMESEVKAYFDPGVGSILLQVLAAGLLAMTVFWRRIRNTIRKLLSRKDKDS